MGASARLALLGADQRDPHLVDDLGGDLGLDLEDVVDLAVEGLRPQLRVVGDADQLRRDADAVLAVRGTGPAHGAFHHVVDAQVLGDLPHGLARAVVLGGAGAGDDAEAADRGQAAGDLLGHAGREVGLFGRPEVLEGQHDHHLAVVGTHRPCRAPTSP